MADLARYATMEHALTNLLGELSVLAGEKVGKPNLSWQEYAGSAALHARILSEQLQAARNGSSESFITFPSPAECLERAEVSHAERL